jgi:O-antigen chain-terminating methyltransferase
VDLDEGMLSACRGLGLRVETADAVAYLQKQASESALVVTAFHLVEHMAFDALRHLVSEALRVLRPGGLLILETPNPENLAVATQGFYLDPTHERPIPPGLLSFVPEYYGYERVKVLRLQENPAVLTNPSLSLNDVLGGASPDYAVVAQKQTSPETGDLLDRVWAQPYGVSSEALAELYRYQTTERIWTMVQQMQLQVSQIESKYIAELARVYASTSWRITAPLRWGYSLNWPWLDVQRERLREHGFQKRLQALMRKALRAVLARLSHFLDRHPVWRTRLIGWSQKVGAYKHLIRLRLASVRADPDTAETNSDVPRCLDNMGPEARSILVRLKRAAQKRMDK